MTGAIKGMLPKFRLMLSHTKSAGTIKPMTGEIFAVSDRRSHMLTAMPRQPLKPAAVRDRLFRTRKGRRLLAGALD